MEKAENSAKLITEEEGFQMNPYHQPEVLKVLKTWWIAHVHLWSGISFDPFRYATDRPEKYEDENYSIETTHETNAVVEAMFGIEKHQILDNLRQRPAPYVKQMSVGVKNRLAMIPEANKFGKPIIDITKPYRKKKPQVPDHEGSERATETWLRKSPKKKQTWLRTAMGSRRKHKINSPVKQKSATKRKMNSPVKPTTTAAPMKVPAKSPKRSLFQGDGDGEDEEDPVNPEELEERAKRDALGKLVEEQTAFEDDDISNFDPSVPHYEGPLSNENVTRILTCGADIDSIVMDKFMSLLPNKEEFSSQSVYESYNFSKSDGDFIQICCLSGVHYVVLSNVFVPGNKRSKSVMCYDPLRQCGMELHYHDIANCAACLLRSQEKKISINYVEVQEQPVNSNACGVNSCMYAGLLSQHMDPTQYKWPINDGLMRDALHRCIEAEDTEILLAMAERKTEREITSDNLVATQSADVFCYPECRRVQRERSNAQMSRMVECDSCHQWIHQICSFIPNSFYEKKPDVAFFVCRICTEESTFPDELNTEKIQDLLSKLDTLEWATKLMEIPKGKLSAMAATNSWYQDWLVNSYLNLLAKNHPDVLVLSTDTFHLEMGKGVLMKSLTPPQIKQGLRTKGQERAHHLLRCTENIAQFRVVLAPVCFRNHFFLFAFQPVLNEIWLLDSLSPEGAGTHTEYTGEEAEDLQLYHSSLIKEMLKQYELLAKMKEKPSTWKFRNIPVVQQENDYDCGAYLCYFAKCLVLGYRPQRMDMPYFRQYMLREVLAEKVHPDGGMPKKK